MRNLRGHRFPAKADVDELQEIMRAVLTAAEGLSLESFKGLTNAERDYLVGCRLVSPDFEWTLPGRALLMDEHRSVSLMINEEDHIRAQALTAGWSIDHAEAASSHLIECLEPQLEFAWSPDFGYLSASPFNRDQGRRRSSMFHLIGLAHVKRLPSVMKALAAKRIVVRGLFGETSRAIGAFVQISVVSGTKEDFVGACDYLIREERDARRSVPRDELVLRAEQAKEFASGSRSISLADALRILAWIRWAASAEIPQSTLRPRAIDEALTTLELRGTMHEDLASSERARALRLTLGIR